MHESLNFDNKKYVSTKLAARMAGYTSDYVGQLYRSGKIEGRMVGRSLYVSEDSLIQHKLKTSPTAIIKKAGTAPVTLLSDIPETLPVEEPKKTLEVKEVFNVPTQVHAKEEKAAATFTYHADNRELIPQPKKIASPVTEIRSKGFVPKYEVKKSSPKVRSAGLIIQETLALALFLSVVTGGLYIEDPNLIKGIGREISYIVSDLKNNVGTGIAVLTGAQDKNEHTSEIEVRESENTFFAYKDDSVLKVADDTGNEFAANITDSLLASVYEPIQKLGDKIFGWAYSFIAGKKVEVNPIAEVQNVPPVVTAETTAAPSPAPSVFVPQKTVVVQKETPTVTNVVLNRTVEVPLVVEGVTIGYLEQRLEEIKNLFGRPIYINKRQIERTQERDLDISSLDDLVLTGAASVEEGITISGGVHFDDSTPSDVSDRLYSDGTDIYWSGTALSSAASSWSSSGGNVYRLTGNVGIGTSSPGTALSVTGAGVFTDRVTAPYFYATSTTATSTFLAGIQTAALDVTSTTASSTFANGINLTGGCFSVNGSCVTSGGGSGSGTVNSGTTGQLAYYASNGTAVSGTSTLFLSTTENVGIGTTSPYAKLSVVGEVVASHFTATTTATSSFNGNVTIGNTTNNHSLLTIHAEDTGAFSGGGIILADKESLYGSWQLPSGLEGIDVNNQGQPTAVAGDLYLNYYSTGDVTLANGGGAVHIGSVAARRFVVNELGNVGVGTSTPYAKLSVVGEVVASHFTATTTATSTFTGGISTNLLNVTSTTASSTFANGINLTGGCFAVNGTCLSSGGGGSGSGTVNSGTTGQLAYYAANGTAVSGTSTLFLTTAGTVGVGTTTPLTGAKLTVDGYLGVTSTNGAVVIGSTTSATRGRFAIDLQSSRLANSIAAGDYSTVVGVDNRGNGNYSSVFGYQNTAEHIWSVAMGTQNNASSTSAAAIGLYNNASGTDATAIGIYNTASSSSSSAYGYDNNALYEYTYAFGMQNTAEFGQFASAFGVSNIARYDWAAAFGSGNIASSTEAAAFGVYNNAFGVRSSAFGYLNTVNGANASAFGSNITNAIATSTMIGPSDAAKLTILGASGSVGYVGIGTTSPYAKLSVVGEVVASHFTATTTATSTFTGGISTNLLNITSTTATSTFASGINLSGGCFAVNGTCLSSGGGGSGSGTVNSGTTGQLAYYAADGTAVSGTSTIFVSTTGNLGLGTTSPFAKLSVGGSAYIGGNLTATGTATISGTLTSGAITSSGLITAAAAGFQTSGGATFVAGGNSIVISGSGLHFNDENDNITLDGKIGIGTSTPYAKLSVVGEVVASHFTATTTATSTFAGGLAVSTTSFIDPAFNVLVNGNVGIGTAAPQYMFDVVEGLFTVDVNEARVGIGIDPSSWTDEELVISNTWGSGGDTMIAFENQNAPDVFKIGLASSDQFAITDVNNNQFLSILGSGNVGIGTTSPYAKLSVVGQVVASHFTATTTATSTFTGGLSTNLLNVTSTTASSTFANGINLTGGCFAVNGTCLSSGGGGSGSGTVNSGTTGQLAYYAANGTAVSGTSTIFVSTTGNLGLGTTSPYAKLSVVGEVVASHFTGTSTATSSFNGNVTIGNASSDDSLLTIYSEFGVNFSGGGVVVVDEDSSYGTWLNPTGLDGINVDVSGQPTGQAGELSLNRYSTGAVLLAEGGGELYVGPLGTNVPRFVVNDQGNVGVGTSTPYAKLSVAGQIVASYLTATSTATSTFTGGLSTNLLNITSATASSTFANGINLTGGCFSVNGSCITSGGGSGSGTVNSGTTGQFAYYAADGTAVSGTSTLFLSTAGNLGLGTTSPYAKLSVVGEVVASHFTATTTATSTFTGGISTNLLNITSTTATSTFASGINLSGGCFAINGTCLSSGGGGGGSGTVNSGTTGQLAYYAADGTAVSGTSTLFVSSAGNVGIGTTSPYAKLSVVGEIVAQKITATSTTATSTLAGGLNVGNGGLVYDYNTGITSVAALETGALSFDTDAGIVSWIDLSVTSASVAGLTQRYTAQLDGNPMITVSGIADGSGGVTNLGVGIGTTTPYAKLSIWGGASGTTRAFEVANAASSTLFSIQDNGSVGVGTTSPWRTFSASGTVAFANLTGNTGAGSLCLSASNEVVYNSASDACLPSLKETKHDIKDLTVNALAQINDLQPVSFVYNTGDGRVRYGFIAENTADVNDHLVTRNAEGVLSGIDDRALLSLTVQGLQDLSDLLQLTASSTAASTTLVSNRLDSFDGKIQALETLVLNVVSGTIGTFTEWMGEKITAVTGFFKHLTVGDEETATAITVFDKNGKEGCMMIEDVTTGDFVVKPGKCSDYVVDTTDESEEETPAQDDEVVDNDEEEDEDGAETETPAPSPTPTGTSTPATSTPATSTPAVDDSEDDENNDESESVTTTPSTSTPAESSSGSASPSPSPVPSPSSTPEPSPSPTTSVAPSPSPSTSPQSDPESQPEPESESAPEEAEEEVVETEDAASTQETESAAPAAQNDPSEPSQNAEVAG